MQGYHLKVASISKSHYSKSRMYCSLNAQGPQVQCHQRVVVYTLSITILYIMQIRNQETNQLYYIVMLHVLLHYI
jgi:hypothetical protein